MRLQRICGDARLLRSIRRRDPAWPGLLREEWERLERRWNGGVGVERWVFRACWKVCVCLLQEFIVDGWGFWVVGLVWGKRKLVLVAFELGM